jgi:Xaa-Pro aminopeptidase
MPKTSKNLHNYILRDENAVYYECGFSCDNEIFLKLGSEAFFITDPRYTLEAKEQVKGAEVIEAERDLYAKAIEILKSSTIKALHFDPNDWSVAAFEKLSSKLDITFTPAPSFSQKKRIIKSSDEILIIKEAARLGAQAFDAFATHLNRQGLDKSEKYLFFDAIEKFQKHGEYALSFEPIVAINANAAKPHALPTDTHLQKGDLLLVDAGLKYQRYCSDRTRCAEFDGSMHFAKSQTFTNATRQKVYDTVLKAQEASIDAVRAGVKANEIDKAGRDVIDKAGFGKFFIHSTGHGVGLDIHEEPFISAKSDTQIEEDMIFTIEPGIYLPDDFGVRIEDMVRVTAQGVEIL